MGKALKIIVILVVIGALVYFGARFFRAPADQPTDGLVSSNPDTSEQSGDASGISGKFINLLLNMRTIKLDNALFESKSFRSLNDFSTKLVPENNVGRPNPFAPIGQDAASGTAAKTISVTTGQASLVTVASATIEGILPQDVVATERWFEWGTTQTIPLANVTTKVAQSAAAAFSYNLTGLSPQTTYYFRAGAKVNGNTIYGGVTSFKTLAPTAQ